MKYDIVCFDLDGTLTDSGQGITNAVMYALRHYDIVISDRRELYCFIGPPLADSFEKYYGFSSEKAAKAVEIYREYFRDIGIFENTVYPGIPALLAALSAAGTRLALATSKPQVFAERILSHFDLRSYFDVVVGSELNGERVKKSEVLRTALEQCQASDTDRVVMVGDRSFDIEGAAACGIPAIGVTYGYGSAAELAGAQILADSVRALQDILL